MSGEYWRHLITNLHPKAALAEAFRVLRTNIQFAALDKPLKTILITSAGPREGKSTTAANLGVAIAQSGRKVILLDGDLRRPSLHKFFRQARGVGLTSVLLGRTSMSEALVETGIDGLRLLPSGPVPPNPSEMLASQAFEKLLAELSDEAEYVLIDSPPSVAVADASLMAARADGTLLVVALGRVAKPMLTRAKEQLANAKANLLGTILTNVGPGTDYTYYYYYYYHYQDSNT